MVSKEIISKNFSRHARHYDSYSQIQDACGARLISKAGPGPFDKILDIGCGTGSYTKLLRERFPLSKIKALDISSRMIDMAMEKLEGERIEFETGDGERICPGETYDLISSNASLQWFEDIGRALMRYKSLLNADGAVLFSVFGPRTFEELQNSIKKMMGKRASMICSAFLKRRDVETILKRFFFGIEIEEKIFKKDFGSLSALLKNIKYTGTSGGGIIGKGIWTRKAMNDLEKIYRDIYKGIMATYQIFFCKGIRL